MRTHHKHVLMCTGPRCTQDDAEAEALFKVLGQTIDACEGLRVKRTRTHCFAVCKQGPLMVVYPDGVWYRNLDAASVRRIVDEHLAGGAPVEDRIFHRTGLGDVEPEPQP
ncbi:(2Fe-2S) ferredoxin domain-containing protein [Ralstonia pseudosolanacearum]|uniref:(2Fe-2S) ferredoxin domain-containing protein n=1 Tax=Ralstonia pseudosolanacearum TaxID=1310165 RepID=UPI0008DB004D|nr:ferredoxin [Ralstonia pseudosolanacearum]MCL1621666.1 ferredoxin [Ralstonia pseudosolanacearum CaRs-Mep]MCQ4678305.1 ferredoxin [Ralstonia pseudosolanacearum]